MGFLDGWRRAWVVTRDALVRWRLESESVGVLGIEVTPQKRIQIPVLFIRRWHKMCKHLCRMREIILLIKIESRI
jgi:hypothetical protein